MSSALRVEQPSRTWWSLSSKSSKQDLHKQYANDRSSATIPKSSPTRAFPSFASVIGFKSKKHPTLAIQDPPSSLKPYPPSRHHPDIPPQFRADHQTRNRLKSAPQPLSPADSVSPLTPVDGFRPERQSLLTLSDADPFAGPGITLHAPSSPTRLSAHSGGSFLDVSVGQDKVSLYVRGSYSSSSSNSYSPQEPQSQGLLRAHHSNVEVRTLSSSKSLSNLRKKANHVDPGPPLPTAPQSETRRSNSRPSTRPRGMTETGYTPSSFLQDTHSKTRPRRPSSPGKPPSTGPSTAQPFPSPLNPGSQPSSRPSSRPSSIGRTTPNQLVPAPTGMKPQSISRQASIQRLQPPTAPPTHELPAPPIKVMEEPALEDELDIPIACNSSMSSSSLSFVSSHSSSLDVITNLLDLQKRRERKKSDLDKSSFLSRFKINPETDLHHSASTSKPTPDTPSSSRALRKTPSLSSLTKRSAQASNSSSSEPPIEPNKSLRKQRSHHRLPIPPIPLGFKHSHTSSFSTPPSPQASEHPGPGVLSVLEQRRGSATSNISAPAPGRKRVFSGASLRRPSTSSGVPPPASNEDDARSLFSLRSDHDAFMRPSSFKPWPSNISTFTSFSDDQPPLSPVRSDYTPQRIMSPEDQAKVEAELDDISIVSPLPPPTVPLPSIRQRTTSASTVFSDQDSEIIPLSIYSLPLSEPTGSPQVSVTKSPKPGVVPMGTPHKSGTTIGRTSSIASKSSVASPRIPHRPATSSGAYTFAPMLVIREPETSRPSTANNSTPTALDTQPPPASPVTPLNIKKNHRKNSTSSTNPPTPQLKSLPPPPRPRAKAQIVTITDSRSDPPTPQQFSEGGGAGNRISIGVDFAHALRHGHVASPSAQSANSSFSVTSTQPVTSMNYPPRPPPALHHVPPVPPRAVSRPPPPSYRKPRAMMDGPQRVPSIGGQQTSSRRVSLHRKPSFLDIDDDDDAEPDSDLDFNTIMRMSSSSSGISFSRSDYTSESFLNFGRESFDTVRSADFGHDNF